MQLPLLLDRAAGESLTEQIVGQLRRAVEQSLLAGGAKLPSSRRLADQLEIGRNTVIRAYEQLIVEGLLETRPGAGVYVCAALAQKQGAMGPVRDSGWSMPIPAAPKRALARGRARAAYDFKPEGVYGPLFPHKLWRRLLIEQLARGGGLGLSEPGEAAGLPSLRSAIATHLAATRALRADPSRIVVTSGARESIGLIARLFLRPGSLAAMEDPGPASVRLAFESVGAQTVGVPTDAAGLDPDGLPARPVALLHVAPSHQFPTGHVLSPDRREQLAAWARRQGCYILEDDADGEFRYEGAHPPAVAALAPDCTIYIGDFSRTLGPGLGLGYLVAPPQLAETLAATKELLAGPPSWLEQAALAELLASQGYAHHVSRARAHYRESRDALLDSLKRHFGDAAFSGEAAGLHLLWHLPPGVPDAALVEATARRRRIGVFGFESAGVTVFRTSLLERRALLIGYGALSLRQIAQGVERLSEAIDDTLDDPAADISEYLVSVPPALGSLPRPLTKARLDSNFRRQLALAVRPVRRSTGPGNGVRPSVGQMAVVASLYHYPVKGLSAQLLGRAVVRAGLPFAHDREFALVRPNAPIDPVEPKWAKKGNFAMLMLDEGLARATTHLDNETLRLRIDGPGRQRLEGSLENAEDRKLFEDYLYALLPNFPGPPKLVRARGGHFMDKPDNVISLINLATVRAVGASWGVMVDPLRFRANIYIDGAPAWSEFEWIGQDIRIGGIRFLVDRRNGRCGATNVNPATGARDIDIPRALRTAYGHKDFGVYLIARQEGAIAAGDAVDLPSEAGRAAQAGAGAGAFDPSAHRFICSGCYFIYDDRLGLPAQGVAPGTPVAAFPDAWRCPDCGSPKTTFKPYSGAA
jgi:GntR family transcriptional regulator/MocR family aminotransferase